VAETCCVPKHGRKRAQARAILKKELKMSNNNYAKRALLLMGVTAGLGAANHASAQVVFDPVTEAFTGVIMIKTGNIDQTTKKMSDTLDHMSGTLDHVDGTVDHISGTVDHMSGVTDHIDVTNNNIDNSTDNISNQTNHNTNYDATFNRWITNNYYGSDEGVIPILSDNSAQTFLDGNAANYKSQYADASAYQGNVASADNLKDVGVQASVNQKAANDTLVDTLNEHRGALQDQSQAIQKLINDSVANAGQGTNTELQYANALAGAQAVQTVEMRSLMLAQANVQAAAAQAAADKDARHVASSMSLRQGLADDPNLPNASGIEVSDPQP
jgi:hypothetical protein